MGGSLQAPVIASHAPAWWHWSEGAHTTGSPPVQAPATQVSTRVQASPSSTEIAVKAQLPVVGLQASAVQAFASLQVLGAWVTALVEGSQASTVHGLPSSTTTGVWTQAPPETLQVSLVQELLSEQLLGAPGAHTP